MYLIKILIKENIVYNLHVQEKADRWACSIIILPLSYSKWVICKKKYCPNKIN